MLNPYREAPRHYIAHPRAGEGEEYGVEYVVLNHESDGRITVAARPVGEAQNGDWGIYTVHSARELFDEPGIAVFFDGIDAAEQARTLGR